MIEGKITTASGGLVKLVRASSQESIDEQLKGTWVFVEGDFASELATSRTAVRGGTYTTPPDFDL
jgi:hypothetical protein